MAEIKYESNISKTSSSAASVYAVVSNLENLNKVKDLIPEDKVKDMEFTTDTAHFKIDGLGQKVCIRIVEKEDNKTIKFDIENIPVAANLWIQMKQVTEGDTRLKLTLKADMPIMFRMMFGNKMQEGLNQATEMLAKMPFEQWSKQNI